MSNSKYNIRYIKNHRVSEGLYFFDANIWLLVLNRPSELSGWKKTYIDFFEEVLEHDKTEIAITSMLLSEIINRYMRDVAWALYCEEKGENYDLKVKSLYKSEYRDTDHHHTRLQILCDDINGYSPKFRELNDELGNLINLDDLLVAHKSLDFNDFHFYKISAIHNCKIVTNDQDFYVPEVEILTTNKRLIDKASRNLTLSYKTKG